MSSLFENFSINNNKAVNFGRMLISILFLLGVIFSSNVVLAEENSKGPAKIAQKQQNPQQKPKSKTKKYNDWYYRCIEQTTDKKAPARQCEVLQVAQVKSPPNDKISKKSTQNVSVLTLAFSKGLPDKKSKKRAVLLTVLTPLNIHLPSGFDLTVDKKKNQ
jgi:invasion protein IalB